MKVSKQARRDGKTLFNACCVNGVLNEDKVRQTVAAVIAQKPRGYVSTLTHCLFWKLFKYILVAVWTSCCRFITLHRALCELLWNVSICCYSFFKAKRSALSWCCWGHFTVIDSSWTFWELR